MDHELFSQREIHVNISLHWAMYHKMNVEVMVSYIKIYCKNFTLDSECAFHSMLTHNGVSSRKKPKLIKW